MERFARGGWRTLNLAQIGACARGERALAPDEFAITFDDAYRGLRDEAFPILEAFGFGAACFVITGFAGRLNRWDVAYGGRRFAHLAWRDMRRWSARGIEFASHTVTHPRLTWSTESQVAREFEQSRLDLADALGVDTAVVSYPFGAAGEREHRLAAAAGYTDGYALAGRWSGNPMHLTRTPVYLWAPPLPAIGRLRVIERWGAIGANRCAVGTSVWQRLHQR